MCDFDYIGLRNQLHIKETDRNIEIKENNNVYIT